MLYLKMISGTDNFAVRQNTIHGGQPITQFYSSTKECTFFGDCSIPNVYNKSPIDTLISTIHNDTYIQTEIEILISNIELINYYTKNEIDSTLSGYTNPGDLYNYVYSKAKINIILDTCYTKSENDTTLNL